jgi:L-rhamnose mutarotase
MKRRFFTLLFILSALSVFGFSPYENYLQSGEQTHVALIAAAKEGQVDELQSALQSFSDIKTAQAFKKVAISNLSSYRKELQGKTWFMIYFDYDGKNYLEAVNAFESTPCVQALIPLIVPHPRAKRYGNTWLQMEWMNYIRGSRKKGAPSDRFAMVTRIKPEKEQEYRTLHQTVWPGVVDQMVRGNYRDFSIFFVEMGDELFEFFHVDYVGTHSEQDDEKNKADPFNQRWWKITDACQDPLPDATGVWSMMNTINPVKK